jgi:hypothetical protein
LLHALAAWKMLHGTEFKKISPAIFNNILQQSIATREWMMKSIRLSREKDYTNPFRKMIYDSTEEMEAVTGKLKENEFIKFEFKQLETYKKKIGNILQPVTQTSKRKVAKAVK